MQVYFAFNVILSVSTVIIVSNIMGSVSERTEVAPEGPDLNPVALAGSQIVSIIMQVCLSYEVILNVWTVVVVSDLMRNASDRTDIIPEGPGINPSCLGPFSNIVNIYAQLLELEDDIYCFNSWNAFLYDGKYVAVGRGYSWVSKCQLQSPRPLLKIFSSIMQVYFACNVILNVLAVIFVSKNMFSLASPCGTVPPTWMF